MVILQKSIVGLSEEGLERFVLRARRAAGLKGAVNLLVTSSAEVRSLNRTFRGINKETDVLSFPAGFDSAPRQSRMAGDVAISADAAKHSATERGHSAADEVKILALHGILHLAGFNHERDNGQMERKEHRLRVALRLPDGLIERVRNSKTGLKAGPLQCGNAARQRAKAKRRS